MSRKSTSHLSLPPTNDKTLNEAASYRHRHTYNTRSAINLTENRPPKSIYHPSSVHKSDLDQSHSPEIQKQRYKTTSISLGNSQTISSKMPSTDSPQGSIYSPTHDQKYHSHLTSSLVRACPAPKSRKEFSDKLDNDTSFAISRGGLSRFRDTLPSESKDCKHLNFNRLDTGIKDAKHLRRSSLSTCSSDLLLSDIAFETRPSRRSTLSVYETPRLTAPEPSQSRFSFERRRKSLNESSDATPASRSAAKHSFSPLDGIIKTKQTPQKKDTLKSPSGRMSLENLLTPQMCHAAAVPELLATLYREQEHDDRDLYKVSSHLAREMTQESQCSSYVNRLNNSDFVRLLTYGEVSCSSISQTIIPFLDLRDDDVFYDLGCGTGKIVVQVAIETACLVSKGIELMKNRVLEGKRALQRLNTNCSQYIVGKAIEIVHGDICLPPTIAPITDASVVFINNVMFGPDLMLKILGVLSKIPNLRRVVTLRRICERHRHEKCSRRGDYCVDYVHPPIQADIKVSWADRTSVYCYQRTDSELSSKEILMNSPSGRRSIKRALAKKVK